MWVWAARSSKFKKMLFLCLNKVNYLSVSKIVKAFLPVLLDLLLSFLFSEGELEIPSCGSWMPCVLKPSLYWVSGVTMMSVICASPLSSVGVCPHTIATRPEMTKAGNSKGIRKEGFPKFLKQQVTSFLISKSSSNIQLLKPSKPCGSHVNRPHARGTEEPGDKWAQF